VAWATPGKRGRIAGVFGGSPWQIPPMRSLLAFAVVVGTAAPAAAEKAPPAEFLEEAKQLSIVGACAKGETKRAADIVSTHCKKVSAEQDAWKKSWLALAAPFFQTTVPSTLPKTVVYPFAGGDLATALTVYPDADEITTLALEPAGDPRSLGRMNDADLKKALAVVASELEYLYRSSFSKTMNMISAMRAGQLPTQLVFSLSALHMHGYELTGVRYFKLDGAGEIVYLTTAEADAAEKIRDVGARNRAFGNVEIKFKKPGGKKEQIYRHIAANLDNEHLKQLAAPLKHLQKKGKVAAMTKAASYLLSYGDFSTFRDYLIANVEWMVSDTTGIPPSYGMPAGFEYETYGDWKSSNMAAGNGAVRSTWQALYQQKPGKPLSFKFGYPNGAGEGHLIVTKRTGNKQPAYLLRWEKAPQPAPPKAPQKDTDVVPPAKPITK
jgi:hypothetical protein